MGTMNKMRSKSARQGICEAGEPGLELACQEGGAAQGWSEVNAGRQGSGGSLRSQEDLAPALPRPGRGRVGGNKMVPTEQLKGTRVGGTGQVTGQFT